MFSTQSPKENVTSLFHLQFHLSLVLSRTFFFYQSIDYNVHTNHLQLSKINQNNMIKMSQTINVTLKPMQ